MTSTERYDVADFAQAEETAEGWALTVSTIGGTTRPAHVLGRGARARQAAEAAAEAVREALSTWGPFRPPSPQQLEDEAEAADFLRRSDRGWQLAVAVYYGKDADELAELAGIEVPTVPELTEAEAAELAELRRREASVEALAEAEADRLEALADQEATAGDDDDDALRALFLEDADLAELVDGFGDPDEDRARDALDALSVERDEDTGEWRVVWGTGGPHFESRFRLRDGEAVGAYFVSMPWFGRVEVRCDLPEGHQEVCDYYAQLIDSIGPESFDS